MVELEPVCRDPKDGDLRMIRMKTKETLVEVRCGIDVQIVRENCA
jgi:hypothetical protein